MENLDGLKYSDLQKLAKKYGIKANQKGDKIITALKELSGTQITLEFSSEGEKECTTATDSEPEEKGRNRKSRKNRRGQKKKNPPKLLEQLTSEDECVSPKNRLSSTMSKSHGNMGDVTTPNEAGISAAKIPLDSKSNSGKKTTARTLGRKQRTSSASQRAVGSVKKSSAKEPRGSSGSSRRQANQNGSFTKSQSENDLWTENEITEQDINDLVTEDEDAEISIRPRRSRSNTFTRDAPSPNVKHLLESMRGDMTADQRKQSLLDALDKNAQDGSKGKPNASSSIPRFTGLAGKKEAAQDGKQRTPGKDWSKIHKRQWDKMDSLDEYLAKKRKRTESVSQSVKKLKLMTEQMRSNMQNRKQQTPGTSAKEPKASLFQSPKTVPFKPKAVSTSEINLNFAKKNNNEKIVLKGKSPTAARPTRKSSDTKIPKAANTLFTIGHGGKSANRPHRRSKENTVRKASLNRKSTVTPSRSDTAVTRRVTLATPGKQRHNSAADRTYTIATPADTAANKSINSVKKFDLQASLAKPVTWKPHKGQLKPFSFGNLHNLQTNYKEAKVKSRDDRRKEAAQRRVDKKSNLQMSRRGITA